MLKLIHYGDMLAVPFFLLLSEYFYLKENKSMIEYFFLFFALSCFFIDIFFTYFFARELMVYLFGLIVLVLVLKNYLL